VPRKRDLRRITRGLRFRLTAGYALLFFVLSSGVAGLFLARLANTLENQVQETLNDQWAAMKGYLRIEKKERADPDERAIWYYDSDDDEENRAVLEIKTLYVITDQNGKVILDENGQPAVSPAYKEIGIDSPDQIRARLREAMAPKPNPAARFMERRNAQGERFKIRTGIVLSEGHYGSPKAPYY